VGPWVAIATLAALGSLGALGAQAGGAPQLRAAVRVILWGALAMAATTAIGALVGQAV
jgi:VIT1/CCC1 family predicted Fe2+/Mn2+ transporter